MIWQDSCKRVAQLLSQRLDEPLGLLDEMKLRLHLRMCGNCANVDEQLRALKAAAGDLFAAPPLDTDEGSTALPEAPKR